MKVSLLTATLIGLAAVSLPGCKEAADAPAAGRPADAATPVPGSGATLRATPNPVPAGESGGTTTISWDAGNHPEAAIYVLTDGADEKLFASGSRGSSEASWIQTGKQYEFRLYGDASRKTLLQRTIVTGAKR